MRLARKALTFFVVSCFLTNMFFACLDLYFSDFCCRRHFDLGYISRYIQLTICCICYRIFIVLYMYSSYVVIIHLNNFYQRKLTTQWLTDALQLKWTVRAAAVRRAALFCILATILIVVIVRVLNQYALWQYSIWSFKFGDTKIERFLPKNQL